MTLSKPAMSTAQEIGDPIRSWCETCLQNVDAQVTEIRRGKVSASACSSCGAEGRHRPAKDIGDLVEGYCLRCRLNLDASVAALVDGLVVKMTCRTCRNEVKYKPPVDERVRKQKALERVMKMRDKRRKGLDESEMKGPGVLRQLWDEMTDRVDARYSRLYTPTATYEIEEAIRHKRHGLGIVHSIHGDGMLHVLFRTGFQELPSGQEPEDEE